MALKGLTIPIWIGWLSGVLVLKRPWGTPTLPSWLTFSTLYCLFGLAMYCILLADFVLNNSGGLALGEEHKFGKYVQGFALTQHAIVTVLQRIAFLLNAKRLGQLFEILSGLEKKHHRDGIDGKCSKKTGWTLGKIPVVSIMIFCSFSITMFSIISRGVEFVMQNAMKPSWLKMLGLGYWGYSFVYFLFAVMPLGIVSNVAYAIIMVTSLRVCRLFCDFCIDIRESLSSIILCESTGSIGRQNGDDILKMTSKMDFLERKKNECQLMSYSGGTKVHPSKVQEVGAYQVKFYSRKHVIDRFEELKDLMKLTNESLSALMLWIICGMTLGIVATASQIFVTGSRNSGINLVTDILVFPHYALYAMLLELGHKIGQMQRKAKLELHKGFLDLQWCLEKDEMEDVIQEIIDWEWKLSASGYFYVNRGLASGIFSLVLNYVVILVQLNIALTESPTCSKNTTLATPIPSISTGLPSNT